MSVELGQMALALAGLEAGRFVGARHFLLLQGAAT